MKTYDEKTWEEIQNPDILAGYTYLARRQTGTERKVHAGTETLYPPNGLEYDVPVYEECLLFHAYTEEDKLAELNKKLEELSAACEAAINSGTKVRFSDGSERLVAYDDKEQANIKELFDVARMGAPAYLYHTPSGDCMMYSAADIFAMYSTLARYKTQQLTYHNKLKKYVQSLDTVPAIQAVQYGDPLTGEYLEDYNTLIAEAEVVLQALLQGVMQSGG